MQISNLAWALGTCRHWSPHLPLLEQQAAALVRAKLDAAGPDGSAAPGSDGAPATTGPGRAGPGTLLRARQLPPKAAVNTALFGSLVWGLAALVRSLLPPLLPLLLLAVVPLLPPLLPGLAST